jgi:hypothetical protein
LRWEREEIIKSGKGYRTYYGYAKAQSGLFKLKKFKNVSCALLKRKCIREVSQITSFVA